MDRDTYKYLLKDRNKVVYAGITNDPDKREAQHRQDKDFDKMQIVGNRCTRQGAEQWETKRIETYMNNHNGNTPKYNKTKTGK